jgi:hypothetical protein
MKIFVIFLKSDSKLWSKGGGYEDKEDIGNSAFFILLILGIVSLCPTQGD